MTIEQAKALRRKIEQASAWTNDADALEMVELFPAWMVGRSVIVGERLRYENQLYKCVQAHVTQADWTPDATPSLWIHISVEEFPEWVQPSGSADAYNTGDKVSHNGKHYISDVDANVWEPSVYGWSVYTKKK